VEEETEAYSLEDEIVADADDGTDADDNDDNDEYDIELGEDEDVDDDEANDTSSPSEDDGVTNTGVPRYMYRSAFARRHERSKVATSVPCSAHTRTYRGHCNVKTVKDVNFFGLNDEYVVSGSDDGNFFIWDRNTTELVNVLEGDGEVVNVVQGMW
jgi:nuclear receptor interaction protein